MSDSEKVEEKLSLEDLLSTCKSRKGARKVIGDYCKSEGVEPEDYCMSPEALHIYSRLH